MKNSEKILRCSSWWDQQTAWISRILIEIITNQKMITKILKAETSNGQKIPSWRDTKNRRMRDCFTGCQPPESMGIARRTELFFIFVTQRYQCVKMSISMITNHTSSRFMDFHLFLLPFIQFFSLHFSFFAYELRAKYMTSYDLYDHDAKFNDFIWLIWPGRHPVFLLRGMYYMAYILATQ